MDLKAKLQITFLMIKIGYVIREKTIPFAKGEWKTFHSKMGSRPCRPNFLIRISF